MPMNKVTFAEGNIYVNGEYLGRLSGTRSEVWVEVKSLKTGTFEFAGRFKYMSPMASAKRYIKYVLQRVSTDDLIEGVKRSSPHGFAKTLGYDWNLETKKTIRKHLENPWLSEWQRKNYEDTLAVL
jgi:hypothetical protein